MPISRRVTHTGKTDEGTIASLGNPGAHWSPRRKAHAVIDINSGDFRYWVEVNGQEVDVHVFRGHLRTDPDKTEKNNLLDLPDC
jgi:predicted oxidoreductase